MIPTLNEEHRVRELLMEGNRRKMLGLRLYRPMPIQLAFHLSEASERLVRGGLRGGKTTIAAAEVSSAATGIALTGLDEIAIPFRYPKDRPLLIWVIGYDEKHIARLYRKLFVQGLFKIIKDRNTRQWRSWRPWEADDASRETETKPSPPLIPGGPDCRPDGFIAEWAWDNKAERVFKVCRLKNGTEIHAFTSGGEAGQGEAVDVIWIDEDIKIPGHVAEWQGRLSDVRGRLIWSAWPHDDNPALKLMSLRAEDQRDREKPDVQEWVLTFSGNPYIPSDEKRKRLEGWAAAGAAVVRARDLGEYVDDWQLVYPMFNIDIHGIPRKEELGIDAVGRALAPLNFRVPNDWTHYLALDPGWTNAAALLVAVPPPSVGKFIVAYDELFAQRCTADTFGELLAKKVAGREFHAFIIDAHSGRQSVLGAGKRIVEFYREAFEKYNIRSRLTDSGFLPGSDDIAARNMTVRDWLNPRPDGTTLFRIVTDTCPYTRNEFRLYKQKVTREEVTEEVRRKDNHLMDCLGYLGSYLAASFDDNSAYYAAPPSAKINKDDIVEWRAKITGAKSTRNQGFFLGAGAVPSAA